MLLAKYPTLLATYPMLRRGIEPRTRVSKTHVIAISLSERILFACLSLDIPIPIQGFILNQLEISLRTQSVVYEKGRWPASRPQVLG